jgi:hypothetical protein
MHGAEFQFGGRLGGVVGGRTQKPVGQCEFVDGAQRQQILPTEGSVVYGRSYFLHNACTLVEISA